MNSVDVYKRAPVSLAKAEWDWLDGDIRLGLLDQAYVADSSDRYWSTVASKEMEPSGDYIPGGVPIEGRSITDGGLLTADDWVIGEGAPVTGNFRFGVIYSRSGGMPLIGLIDFGPQAVTDGVVTVAWNGWVLRVAP